MTKRERAQVTALLRCIYDIAHGTNTEGTTPGFSPRVAILAINAFKGTRKAAAPLVLTLRDAMLEAAARIEEGWTP